MTATPSRVLIVDDEPLARDRLRGLLKGETSVQIVGECGNGNDALTVIRSVEPEIVFLDVQMPGINGLQVAGNLPPEKRPAIIFVTAHDQFAVEAFGVQAVDYLLKPFDRERFRQALQRAQEWVRTRASSPVAPAAEPSPKSERLTVKSDGRVVFIRPDEIIWIEAADNYVLLHLETGRVMVRETLTALEGRLDSKQFVRVNRSAVVSLDRIKELQPTFHGDYVVILREGTKIPLSRNLRSQLGKLTGEAG